MNTLINAIENKQNVTTTENGAATLKSTLKATVDFFGLGGALRTRTDKDVISLFSKAFAEDPLVAVKTLFYIRDVRAGQGERKTFRTCFAWLAKEYPEVAIKNVNNVVEFGRWDDLYCTRGTKVWTTNVLPKIQKEWFSDKTSLFYKWLPSQNASSSLTKQIATEIINYLGVTPRTYRKKLSEKRAELDVVERKMCSNNWNQINYKGVPSKAALNYKGAFEKHDPVRYAQFIADVKSGKTTINAGTLYPYDIVEKCFANDDSSTLDVLWNSLPNYSDNDNTTNGIVVADVSGSMSGRPMAVSISLAMYISERNKGAFKDRFITFSEKPTLQKVIGNNIREKVSNLQSADWGMSTNLESVFNLILDTAQEHNIPASELPTKIYIVSDMEFNQACTYNSTLFQSITEKYKQSGYERPELVFWNVNAKNTHTPVRFDDKGTCLVSGCSPSILKSLLNGKIVSAEQVMLDTINVSRYSSVNI